MIVCPVDGWTNTGIFNRKFMKGPVKAIINDFVLEKKIYPSNTYEDDNDYNVPLGNAIVALTVDHNSTLVHEYKH